MQNSRLILFDLDNTLLAGDSDFEWAQFLIEQGVLDRELYEAGNRRFYEQYRAGILDIHEFLDFQLKPLSRHPRVQLEAWHHRFMVQRILPMITQQSRALVAREREAGGLLVIITATNRFVTGPIARELGVGNLIATEPEERDGEFTGRVRGVPSFREGKIARLKAWLEENALDWGSFASTRFYSDSLNDLPLLAMVTEPIAVDPDDTLRAHAALHGWPIITLR
jgi:HAD superfamily hydrolase (TIGR01490 family)